MSKKVDQLIEELVTQHRSVHGNSCWATKLTGDAQETVAKLRTVEASGVKINRDAMLSMLRREFDIRIAAKALVTHLKGHCRCD